MLYYRCPECGNLLANKQLTWEKELAIICAKSIPEMEKNKMKKELLNKLKLKRYCCRMRIMGYVRLINIIV